MTAVAVLVAVAALLHGRPCRAEPGVPQPTRRGVQPSCWEARFLDVGQGDATVIRTGSGEAMVVDAGPRAAAARVLEAVRALGRTPDRLVLTHAHADHIGGANALLDTFRALRILDAGLPFGSRIYRAILRTLAAQGRTLEIARRGQRFTLGPRVTVEVLAPQEPLFSHSRSNANANSVMLRVRCGAVSMLLAADAERETEDRLLAHGELAAEVLKVPHHGSRYASSAAFLEAVHPEVAVISCGRANRYRHPAPSTLERLAAIGASVFRTDTQGDVVVRSDGTRVEALVSGVR